MRNQQTGMPQPHSRQQSGLNDMQLWQQQVMYKQFQELQRQHQLQQLDQEAKQHNPSTQLSVIQRQTSGNQLPTLGNGVTTINDSSNYMWPAEVMGGDSKVSNASQMFIASNMNWVQRSGMSPSMQGFPNGLMFQPDQAQALRSTGFVSHQQLEHQQLEQSLYGAPVTNARAGSLNQYSHFQGISQDGSDMFNKAGGSQVEKLMMQSPTFNSFQNEQSAVFPDQGCLQDGVAVSKQASQEKTMFGQVPSQTFNSGIISGNFHQLNSIARNVFPHEFNGRQERVCWEGNLQEKPATQVSTSQSVVSLDPTEEKILFNTDDNIWEAFGRNGSGSGGAFLQRSQLDGVDYLNSFPSVQSGSWSALMQSAVAEASSSDTGLQEEWSGPSFQKTEHSTGNHPSAVDSNLHNSSSLTSRPFPLFGDANVSASGLQQSSTDFAFEQSDRVRAETSHESRKQSPKEGRWMDQSAPQKPLEGNFQVQTPMQLENASQGAWGSHMYEQPRNVAQSADELNGRNVQGHWLHQQNISLYNTGGSKLNAWNINEALSPSGDSQSSDYKRAMHVERAHDAGTWKAHDNLPGVSFHNSSGGLDQIKLGTGSPQVPAEDSYMSNFAAVPTSSTSKPSQDMNQQAQHTQQLEYGRRMVGDSSVRYRGNESVGQYQHQPSNGPHPRELPTNNDRISGETYDKKQENSQQEISSDSYISVHPHFGQHTINRSSMRENTWLNASDSRLVASNNQKSVGQSGRKPSGSRMFQYHPMGNVAVEASESATHVTHSQGLLQTVAQGQRNQEVGYFGQSKFAGHIGPNNAMNKEKGLFPESQSNNKGAEELATRGAQSSYESNVSTSFDGSAGFYVPNKRTFQTSQNMLELLHKVDQSRENNATAQFGSSDHNSSDIPESAASDASVAHLQSHQSPASQGFGLWLGPPSQRLSMTNSQSVKDLNSRQIDTNVGDKDRSFLSTTSVQSLSPAQELSQRDWVSNNNSKSTSQTGKEVGRSNMQGNSYSTDLPSRNQLSNQHISTGSGQVVADQSTNRSFGNQPDFNSQIKVSSQTGRAQNSHDGALADQSAQASPPDPQNRVMPFNSAPFYPSNTGRSQPSFMRGPVLQDPIPASQGGGFSTKFHNVWTNVPGQQHGGLQHKVPPSLFQPMCPPTTSLETTPVTVTLQQEDDQSTKKSGSGPNEFGTCTVNSQQFTYGEEQQTGRDGSLKCERVDLASQQQEPAASSSLLLPPHQQEPSQTETLQNTSTSNNDMEAFGRSLRSLNIPHQNYSLLHQMQALRDVETDPNAKSGKKLKGTDSSVDTQQVVPKSTQRFLYGFGTSVRDHVDNDSSSDAKMLSFYSEGKEEQSANASSQTLIGDVASQNHSRNLNNTSTSLRGTEHTQPVNPQMAPSWFEQYGTYKNGQILAMYDGLDSSRRNAKTVAQQFFFGKIPDSLQTMPHTTDMEQANGSSCAAAASEHLSSPQSLPLDTVDDSLAIVRPNKRKSATLELLPWHKEITQSFQRLQTISDAELAWAQVAVRRVEKLEDEAEIFEDGFSITRPRRRLILTTQLMQLLLRSIPAAVFSAEAKLEYETVTYFAARSALGDACSLISGSDSHMNSNNGNMVSKRHKASGSVGECFSSKIVEDFIGRARKLESDLLRLDKRSSILDIRVECMDLEKFSIINRFARFHGRGNSEGAESSSASETATTLKARPQRYVTALPMSRNLPEGVPCLSL